MAVLEYLRREGGCKRSFSQEYLISASAGRTDQDRKGRQGMKITDKGIEKILR
ncbi:MAG: hypothetical protein ACLTK0_04840 [Anaerovoracaceae bacterium]